jgi:hypothetical protein
MKKQKTIGTFDKGEFVTWEMDHENLRSSINPPEDGVTMRGVILDKKEDTAALLAAEFIGNVQRGSSYLIFCSVDYPVTKCDSGHLFKIK